MRNILPTSADIVHRFGLNSPIFVTTAHTLHESLQSLPIEDDRKESFRGDKLKSIIIGRIAPDPTETTVTTVTIPAPTTLTNASVPTVPTDTTPISDPLQNPRNLTFWELLIRQTYLCQFAKILVYSTTFGTEDATRQIESIIDETAFEALGVSNIEEQNLFSWVLAPQIRARTLNAFRHMAESLAVYDLSHIHEDLLKSLYQNLVGSEARHESGEFYTPDWLAELILREIGYRPGQSLLDPSCGSGTFLFRAIRLLTEQGMTGQELVEFALENIQGMDIHPVAVTIARANYILALLPHLHQDRRQSKRSIPIILSNALHSPDRGTGASLPAPQAGLLGMALITSPPDRAPSLGERYARPLRQAPVDVVVGNPPWLAYRYIQDQTYQREIKKLIHEYQLLAQDSKQLNTQIELATLFFEHCRKVYLKPTGTIAFIMPRSVLTGAKQHHAFQQYGFSRILDLKEVEPLFNVETCVLIRNGDAVFTEAIPTTRFDGKLPTHECTFPEATVLLTRTRSTTNLIRSERIGSPYYHSQFKQGATLVPRNLVFVQPDLDQISPAVIMCTDPEVNDDAKPPWRNLSLQGHIYTDFLYATLLSRHLLPFGVRKLHLVALPVQVVGARFIAPPRFIAPSALPAWFESAEKLWQQHKKATVKETLTQWLNYHNKLLSQSASPGYLVLYAAAGSNLAACVIDTHVLPVLHRIQPGAFVVDSTTYWYRCATKDEAHFLSALLNAPSVNKAIKVHQTRGLFGERHIHRRPFEVCPIPQFDPTNPDHWELAALSQAAHTVVAATCFHYLPPRQGTLSGGQVMEHSTNSIGAARRQARQATRTYLEQIDAIAQRLLGLTPASDATEENNAENSEG